MARDIQAGVLQGSVLSPTLYSIYINDTPQTPGVYLGLFTDDTCIYVTDCKECYVLRKLQPSLSASKTWCEHWNIKMNEKKTETVCFAHRLRSLRLILTLHGWNIPFISHVKYLGVISGKRITRRLHIEMIEAKDFRTFIRMYSLFKSEHLSGSIKLTPHKALIRSVMSYTWPA
jgi:hypothetical protein